MRLYRYCLLLFLFLVGYLHAGESPPAWLSGQLSDISVLAKPGVYRLKDSRLLGVGQGKAHASLRGSRSQQNALDSAEHDAKRRIAKYINPEVFEKYKNVSTKMQHARRVYEQKPTSKNPTAYVGIVVDSKDVSVTPLPDASIILDANQVVVSPEMLIYLEDPLLQMGGGRIFSRDEGWIVVGVGVAPLFGNDSTAERDAMKRARLDAGKAIAQTVFGSSFEVLEQEAESQIERNGIVAMRQWVGRRTRENIKGELNRTEEVGYWLTRDNHLAVVLAVSNMPLNLSSQYPEFPNGNDLEIPDYPDWNVEPEWEYVLLAHPRLLKGGAIIAPESGGIWVVGVGAAKLTGNIAHDQMNTPRAAQLDAQRHIVRYLSGFSTRSNTQEIEEVTLLLAEDGMKATAVIESLQKITKEAASGMVRGLRTVGSWKAMDRNLLYQAHAVELKNID